MIGKSFSLKYDFKNIEELDSNVEYLDSPEEEHFGVPWCLYAEKKNGYLGVYLYCEKLKDEEKPWSIDVDFTISTNSGLRNEKPTSTDPHELHNDNGLEFSRDTTFDRNEGDGFHDFAVWDDVIKKCMTDNTVSIECHVTIKKMVGFSPEKTVDFGESVEHQWNMLLGIGERKFRVSKMYLSYHSTEFDKLFIGVPVVNSLSELDLDEVDPNDFQSFLEIIYTYAISAIQAENVEGLLLLAKRFKVKLVLDSCEKFLLKNDTIDKRLKMRLADSYGLKDLKNDILESIRALSDLQYCVPVNTSKLSKEMLGGIVKKCIELVD